MHEKNNDKLPALNKLKPRKQAQDKENKIKINPQMVNQSWNDWRFQIYWNMLEWVNPRSHSESKNQIFVSSKECFV